MKALIKWLVIAAITAGIAYLTAKRSGDDSDPPHGWSWLTVRIDHLTGCEYLQAGYWSGLAPRLDATGKQICYRHAEDIPQ